MNIEDAKAIAKELFRIHVAYAQVCDELAAARAENERLRKTLDDLARHHGDMADEADSEGSHVGIARYHRIMACAYAEAATLAAQPPHPHKKNT